MVVLYLALRRALVLPAPGTPYSGGAFVFDILLPPNYPDAPPKVRAEQLSFMMPSSTATAAGSVEGVLGAARCSVFTRSFASVRPWRRVLAVCPPCHPRSHLPQQPKTDH